MQLKKLELIGFKTFAEKTELEFPSFINCIVGPNGSGKSNIADAIKWVLGEQSLKDIRSRNLEEVIFNGTEKERPAGLAEVSLSLDNGNNSLPIEYTEINIKRRVYRSGESEYFINKTPCRLKDIQNLFMGTGLGKNTYSIITQGKVDLILSNRPDERRLVFDEAAGISRFKYKKREVLRNLEQVKNDLIRIKDIIREVEDALSTLANQKKRAEEYTSLKEQIYNLELSLRKEQLKLLSTSLTALEKKSEEQNNNIIIKEKDIKNVEIYINRLKEEINKIETSLEAATHQLDKIKFKIDYYEKEIAINKAQIDSKENEIVFIHEEQENTISSFTATETRLRTILNQIIGYTLKLKEYELIIKEKLDNRQQLEYLLGEENKNVNSIKNELTEIIRKKLNTKNELNYLLKLINDKQKEKNILQDELNKKNELLKNYHWQLFELNLKYDALYDELEQLNIQINRNRGKIKLIDSDIKSIEKQIDNLNRDLTYIDTKLELCKLSEGNINLNEVEGRLVDKINIKDETKKEAVEAIIDDYRNALIVKDYEIIEKLLPGIKNKITLLPLTAYQEDIESNHELKKYIEYDNRFENIINYIFNEFVIVDNLPQALKLIKENNNGKFVTKDGIIVTNKFVRITEGKDKLLRERQRIISLIQEMIGIKETKEKEKNELEEIISNLLNAKDKIKEEIDKKNTTLNLLTAEINALAEEIHTLNKETIENATELENLTKEKIRLIATIEEYDEVEKEVNTQFNELKEKIDKIAKDYTQINDEIQKMELDKKLIIEKKEVLINNKKVLEEELTRLNNSIYQKQVLINNINEEKNEKLTMITNYWCELDKLYREYSEKKATIDKLIEEKKSKINERENVQLLMKNYNDELISTNQQLNETKLEIEKIKFNINNIYKKLDEEYNIQPDRLEEVEQLIEIDDIQKCERRLTRLKNALNNLGPVDLTSINEYEVKKQKYELLKTQEEDLERTREKLLLEIKEIDKEAKNIFMKTFNEIALHFNTLFTYMFGEGGTAYLRLVENDNGNNDILEQGVEIEVQLPKKRMQSLALLSGGERALVTIALIFAMLKVNPAPFCILDEVDAALDDTNVTKFTSLLKEFAKDTQFIIITHNKGTMKVADVIYGVTMEKPGISKLISMHLKEAEKIVE